MSIAAPATNPASDLELKLPATIGTANQVLRNSSTPGTLEFASPGKVLNIYYIIKFLINLMMLLTNEKIMDINQKLPLLV